MASSAERVRRYRERQRFAAERRPPLIFERPDWRLFIDARTLPQKAGCEPGQIGRVILKELTDNALDSGAGDVDLVVAPKSCVVSDNGPGIDPDQVPRLLSQTGTSSREGRCTC